MIVTLDPTQPDLMTLDIDGRILSWASRSDRAGARLIAELKKCQLSKHDELRAVAGPGGSTDIRIAALVANAVSHETGVQLFSRRADEVNWQEVTAIVPIYAAAPQITPPKKEPLEKRIEIFVMRPPRESRLRRVLEIIVGVPIFFLGLLLIPTPGPGIPTMIAGVLLVSPWHGRRVAWFGLCGYKWIKAHWFQKIRGHGRVIGRARHFFFRHPHRKKK